MKKVIFVLTVLTLMLMHVNAQKKMVIHFSDGTAAFEKLVKNVTKITFEDVEALMITENSVTNITYSGARINMTVSGYFDENTEVGVVYSDSEEELVNGGGTRLSGTPALGSGSVFFLLTNLEQQTTYYYRLYVRNGEYQSVESEVCLFTTVEKRLTADVVDLGLSVKWASWNIGANGEADYGQLYVWGDPDGTLNLQADLNYLYNLGNIAGTEYDIATKQWGKDWRIPTESELKELASLSVKEETDYQGSGVRGMTFTAPNGNSIFIPATGYRLVSGGRDPGTGYLYYWSGNKNAQNPSNIRYANIGFYGVEMQDISYKTAMMPVRPVFVGEDPSEHDGETPDAGESIDLGLSVKWGDRNVGATSSAEAGNYYAWGETEIKTEFSRVTYKWTKDEIIDSLDPYQNIGNDISETDYDVARKMWGGKWRMPTSDEMKELVENCTWSWTFRNGMPGYEVKRSGYNGSLFFVGGFGYAYDNTFNRQNNKGCYWTSSFHSVIAGRSDNAWCLEFDSSSHEVTRNDRSYGLLIRPVRSK